MNFDVEAYKQSMLKAFAKTVEESRFPFVILDAPNIQVEDFKPFYMAAQVFTTGSFHPIISKHRMQNFLLKAILQKLFQFLVSPGLSPRDLVSSFSLDFLPGNDNMKTMTILLVIVILLVQYFQAHEFLNILEMFFCSGTTSFLFSLL